MNPRMHLSLLLLFFIIEYTLLEFNGDRKRDLYTVCVPSKWGPLSPIVIANWLLLWWFWGTNYPGAPDVQQTVPAELLRRREEMVIVSTGNKIAREVCHTLLSNMGQSFFTQVLPVCHSTGHNPKAIPVSIINQNKNVLLWVLWLSLARGVRGLLIE